MDDIRMDDDFDIFSNEYGSYVVPKSFHMRVLPKFLARGQVYEPRTIKYICDNAKDGDVISGGAFIGDFLPAISKALAPGRFVHTFEPNPLCFEACRRTVELNKLQNVKLHACAVGNKAARLPLRVHDFEKDEPAAAQSALNPRTEATAEGYIEVEVKTLDEIVGTDRKVTVLHLDIEGFERQALRGARKIVRFNRPVLVIEGKRTTEEWLANAFPQIEYKVFGTWEKNQIFTSTAAPRQPRGRGAAAGAGAEDE